MTEHEALSQPGQPGREACLVRSVFTLHHLITRVADRMASGIGLTSSRWLLLCTIGSCEHEPTVGELSERASLSVQAVSRMLAAMEAEGLVIRSSRPGKGRAVFVSLTEAGLSALAATVPLAERFEAGLLRGLSSEDHAEADRLLGALIVNVLALEEEVSQCEP